MRHLGYQLPPNSVQSTLKARRKYLFTIYVYIMFLLWIA